ncbi:transmembrane protein, putative [Medicago truncatula]|uniref:Transmembrane protein, putative n=1 Tax=Medicago truncatula TaxID=3880 RepID=G7K4F0_MEDTR|nr:transmembrane protein, putative [Medicago truncatula]
MAEECFTKVDLAVSNRPKLEVTKHLAYNGAMFPMVLIISYGLGRLPIAAPEAPRTPQQWYQELRESIEVKIDNEAKALRFI